MPYQIKPAPSFAYYLSSLIEIRKCPAFATIQSRYA